MFRPLECPHPRKSSALQTAPLERVPDAARIRMAEPTHGTFRLGWLRSGSRLTSEEPAPSGAQHDTAHELAHVLDTTEVQAGGLCGRPRAPDSQTLSAPGSRDSSPGLPPSPPMSESAPSPKVASPMARTLSFARRPLSKEEEAELYAAAPDEVLSPGSAQVLRSALQAEADETIVASSLVCPITNELMTDPVFTMDGQTYERSAIEAWLRNHDTSPATGKPLPSKMLVTNVRARSMLADLPEQVSLT